MSNKHFAQKLILFSISILIVWALFIIGVPNVIAIDPDTDCTECAASYWYWDTDGGATCDGDYGNKDFDWEAGLSPRCCGDDPGEHFVSAGVGSSMCCNSASDCVSNVGTYADKCYPNQPESNANGNCDDGIDNDCDGATDCDDSDCAGDPACCWNSGVGVDEISPLSPEPNIYFEIICHSNNECDCIHAYANNDSNECVYMDWLDGNHVIFSCVGMSAGTYTAKCKSITGTSSNCCPDERTMSYIIAPCCISHSSFSCFDNDVYWYDSCGNREDKKQECGDDYCYNNNCFPRADATISLVEDWSFISLPIEPVNNNTEKILEPIKSFVNSIWHYNGDLSGWYVWSPGAAADNLLTLEPGKGYQIRVSQDVILPLYGTSFIYPSIEISAEKWYMIGAPAESIKLYDMLGTCEPDNLSLSSINSDGSSFTIEITPDTMIETKKGYWLKSSIDCTFSFYCFADGEFCSAGSECCSGDCTCGICSGSCDYSPSCTNTRCLNNKTYQTEGTSCCGGCNGVWTNAGADSDLDTYDNQCETYDNDPCSVNTLLDNCGNALGGCCAKVDQNYCDYGCVHCGDGIKNCGEVCEKGTTRSCTGACGSGTEYCKDDCSGWHNCDAPGCDYSPACSPLTETQSCGNCGTQTRNRTTACCGDCTAWSSWSVCIDEGVCSPGATQSCGNCGTQTCSATCSWGSCDDKKADGESCSAGSECCSGDCTCGICGGSCDYSPACTNTRCLNNKTYQTEGTACCGGCNGVWTNAGADSDLDTYDNECENYDNDPCSVNTLLDNCGNALGGCCAKVDQNYCDYGCVHCGDGLCNCGETYETCSQDCEIHEIIIFLFKDLRTCIVGDKCVDTCITVAKGDGTVYMEFEDNNNFKSLKPSNPEIDTYEQKICLNPILTDSEMNDLKSEVNQFITEVDQWTSGSIILLPKFIEISGEITMSKWGQGFYTAPWDSNPLIRSFVTKDTDFIIVSQDMYDEILNIVIPIPACGGTLGSDVGVGGAGYNWIPKTHPGVWFECANKGNYMHEWLNLMDWVLLNVSSVSDIYESGYPPCGEGNTNTYLWFPGASYDSIKDPNFEACGQDWSDYCNSVQPEDCNLIWHKHILETHYDPSTILIGNHCRNGKQDFDETGVDEGGKCAACLNDGFACSLDSECCSNDCFCNICGGSCDYSPACTNIRCLNNKTYQTEGTSCCGGCNGVWTNAGTDSDLDEYDNECENYDNDPCSVNTLLDNCGNALGGCCAKVDQNYCDYGCAHCGDGIINCSEECEGVVDCPDPGECKYITCVDCVCVSENDPDGTECGADFYDDWMHYCEGDEDWKHHLFHDFYCVSGTCDDHTFWQDDQLIKDCSLSGNWDGDAIECNCDCNGYDVQESPVNGNCNDGKDNDCNGLADEQDLNCEEVFSSAFLYSVDIPTQSLAHFALGKQLSWNDNQPANTDVKYQIEYYNGISWQLIPDIDLPGNSVGLHTSPVNISCISMDYSQIRLRANLSTTDTLFSPSIQDWNVNYYCRNYISPEPFVTVGGEESP
ncbi:hypothetical protein KAU40_01640 [Candidatus Parcubacteria bacterium]|nr:hypothetical protein [Candidatus Parcubacteria bacterium]